jgi:transcriptional regulator with GAF, ATPase, and Fis domain
LSWDDRTTRCVSGGLIVQSADGPRLAVHRQILTVIGGANRGQSLDVALPTVRIGSAPANDLVLGDDTVSAHHCEIVCRDGRFVLRDLGSTNGTSVDGVFVLEAYVTHGARIGLGETQLLFEGQRAFEAVAQSRSSSFGELIGASELMRSVFGVLERVAPTDLSLLLTGETGTGKDLAARATHEKSARAGGPFVVVDCGALAKNLVEAQLFGHERGAFTGAERSRKGAFERGHGGTVFLDEIGELPLDLQPKLLRVLERREVEPLGAADPIPVDVRVLAATHRDLSAMVERGEFRDDLYFRLGEVIVELPPLRDRRDDLPALASHLLGREPRGSALSLARDAHSWLAERAWPGNVRELRNVIRKAAVFAEGAIGRATLESLDRMSPRVSAPPPASRGAVAVPIAESLPIKDARQTWIDTMEREYLGKLVARYGEDVDAIAGHMNLHRKSVVRLLRAHGLMDEPS